MLTNHELVRFYVGIVVLVGILTIKSVRKLIWSTLKFFLTSNLFVLLILFVAYSFLLIHIANLIGIWKPAFIIDTFLFLFTLVVPFSFQLTKRDFSRNLFSKFIKIFMKGSVLIGLYLGLTSFSIGTEIILFTCSALIQLIALILWYSNNESKSPSELPRGLFVFLGIVNLLFVTFNFTHMLKSANFDDVILKFAMLIWLPVGLYPFVYITAYYSHISNIYSRMRMMKYATGLRIKIGFALFVGLRARLNYAQIFEDRYQYDFPQLNSYITARRFLIEFRRALRKSKETESG